MTIVVGLGNPGPEHRDDRHNVGYRVIEEIERRHGGPPHERGCRSILSGVRSGASRILLARPLTYMNRSGAAVAALLERESASAGELLVVCDDLYLEFGELRLRRAGSHGGHNGLRSIIDTIGTRDFPRLRIGVGPSGPAEEYADFVLAPFANDERARLPEVIARAADCVHRVADEGIERAMNHFNRRAGVGAAGADPER